MTAIIVAAGRGQRAGGETPKQRQSLGGKPVFRWSVDAFLSHPKVDRCVIVVPAEEQAVYAKLCPPGVRIVAGGSTRTASVGGA